MTLGAKIKPETTIDCIALLCNILAFLSLLNSVKKTQKNKKKLSVPESWTHFTPFLVEQF